LKSQRLFPLTNRKPDEIIAFRAAGAIRVESFLAEAVTRSRQLPDHRYTINLHTDRYRYLLEFCAAAIAGQCTLMPPNRLATSLEQLVQAYPDSYTTGDSGQDGSELRSSMPEHDLNSGNLIEVPEIPSDQLCAIAFTSGSTGTPSENLKYWETLRTGTLGNAQLMLKPNSGRMNLLATVPPQHMWGFETSVLLPLFANAAVSHLTPFFPQDIADALEQLPEPRALVSSPVHLGALLKSGVGLVQLDRIYSATAPLSVEMARELESRSGARVLEIFGCSESGILAARHTATETLWRLSDLFELEPADDGALIRAQHLPEDVVLPDLVELSGKRRFRWIGRHQDMINIAGKRGSLADLNHRLLAIPGVNDGVIFIRENSPERTAALVVAPRLHAADIIGELKSQIDPAFLPRPVLMVPCLPRQETGKLAKKAVQELFETTARAREPGNRQQKDRSVSRDST